MAGMLKPADVAAQFNCSVGHVRKLCRTGQLHAMRLSEKGRADWRISPAAVEAYQAGHTNAAPATEKFDRFATTVVLTEAPFELPAGYVPVFPQAWGLEPTAINAASPAAGRTRGAGKEKARSVSR